jgi:predicted amidohydrolase
MADAASVGRVVVALFQGRTRNGDVKYNKDNMKKQILRASAAGAELIIFPELFLSGYCVPGEEMKRLAEERDGPSFRELSQTARESNIAVLYGYPEVDGSSRAPVYYNSAQLIDRDGSSLVNYRKTHLWISPKPPVYESIFTPGSKFEDSVECCGVRIGVLICHDSSLSEPSRCLALSGADFIAIPTANSVEFDRRSCTFVSRARALDNGVYVALVNHVGDGMCGCSQLCNPEGTVVVYAGSDSEETLLLGTVSLPVTRRIDYIASRRPELYTALKC